MPTLIPTDGLIFLLVTPHRVVVSRYVKVNRHFYRIEYASNWPDLERDAHLKAQAQLGILTFSTQLPCPPDLAASARFD